MWQHLFQMYHTGVLLHCQYLITQFWCPYDCPTPYPHSLTSIFPVGQSTANPKSLPASPWRRASVEQMASVCRAAIKEGAPSGEKKVGQDQGGAGPATWSCLCRRPAHRRMHLRILWRTHIHTRVHASVNPFPDLPRKNKYPPHASQKTSAV